jgi:two-component system chemotaxis response regulator CheB
MPGVTIIPAGTAAVVGPDGLLRLAPRTARSAPEPTGGDDLVASAAATAADGGVIGVVLSGRGHDGAEGIRAVKRHGGRVLAQDPATAQARDMPSSAIATGCVDFVLPPERMPAALTALAMAPGGAQLLAVPTPHWARLGA